MVWGDHNCLMTSDPVQDNFEVILTRDLEQVPVDPDTFRRGAGERHGIFAVALLLERRLVALLGKPAQHGRESRRDVLDMPSAYPTLTVRLVLTM